MRVKIENVTASIRLDHGIDLGSLDKGLVEPGASDSHPMVIVRPTEATAVQIYENGNVIGTGSRSTQESKTTISMALGSLGIEHDPDTIEVRDIMASTIVDHDINLEKAYMAFGTIAEYNPEWFSGVIVHYDSMGTTGIIYSGGKVVVSGAANMDLVYDTFDALMAVLKNIEPS